MTLIAYFQFMLTFFSILIIVLPTRSQSTYPLEFGDFSSFLLYFEELEGPFKVYLLLCLILEAKPQLFLLLWSLKGIDLQTLICLEILETNNIVVLETAFSTDMFKVAKLDFDKSVLD